MNSRYDHLFEILNKTKPQYIAELGISNINITKEIYETVSKFYSEDELYLLLMGDHKNISEYKDYFKNYQLKNSKHCLLFFDLENNVVDLEATFNINNKNISFKNFEFVFINNFDELDDYISSLEIFNEAKYYFLDRYFMTNDYDILKKGCFHLLECIDHVPLPKTDQILIRKNADEMVMVETAAYFINNENEQLRNVVINNINSESNKLKLVPDSVLLSNIENNLNNLKNLKNLLEINERFLPDNKHIIHLVGSGPSLYDEEILNNLKNVSGKENNLIFCTKSSLNILLEKDIIPYGVIITDPRKQVLDYLTNSKKLTEINSLFFVSTLCDVEVFNYLNKLDKKICYFNEINDVVKNSKLFDKLNKKVNVDLGVTSVISGIYLLNDIFGFTNINLYGIDSSYDKSINGDEIYGISKHKRKTMVNLKLDNSETTQLPLFESDIELLRQCIEMKRLLENKKISFKNFSKGLMKFILMDQKKLT